jgi:hypothetical protein
MNNNQRYSPKYWVAHDTRTDDVLISTASKSLSVCHNLTRTEIGTDDEFIEYILVSLVEVDV